MLEIIIIRQTPLFIWVRWDISKVSKVIISYEKVQIQVSSSNSNLQDIDNQSFQKWSFDFDTLF